MARDSWAHTVVRLDSRRDRADERPRRTTPLPAQGVGWSASFPVVSVSGSLPPVCVLAGGRGTRLGPLTATLPKPLLRVAGRPFVEHQLELLRAKGASRVVLCIGYLGELIEQTLGDGSRFGLELCYSRDGPRLLGTAGAVRRALPLLGDEFLVLYGDTYLRIDYADVARAFRASSLPALMTVLQNRGAWGRSNARYADGRILGYDKSNPPAGADWIDYGLLAFHRGVFQESALADVADLTAELADRQLLAGYPASERFYEIGDPRALAETEQFLTEARGEGRDS